MATQRAPYSELRRALESMTTEAVRQDLAGIDHLPTAELARVAAWAAVEPASRMW